MKTHPVLDQLASSGVRMGLDRIQSFLQHLGEPQRAYPAVHIAGTNGKGSVSMMVTEALVAAGNRVGTTLSPHLEHVNERIRIDGQPIDDALLNEGIEALDRQRWTWAQALGLDVPPLTYFEFMTVLALQVFAQHGVNIAVIEVGLGGREDATNVIQPLVCAITHIGLDHTDRIGQTIEKIAREKAGILKPRVPVVLGPLRKEALAEIEQAASFRNCEVWKAGPAMRREFRSGAWGFSTPHGSIRRVTLKLRGAHQGANASVAVGVLHQLQRQGFLIPDEAIHEGLSRATLEGRIETLLPALTVDGAHNIDGTEALAAWLTKQPRPETRILLWGVSSDKDPVKLIQPLLPLVDEIVTCSCSHPRSWESMDLAVMLQKHVDVDLSAGGRMEEALPEVYREAHETIVAGSLFIAGAARSVYRSGALDGIEPGQGPPPDEDED